MKKKLIRTAFAAFSLFGCITQKDSLTYDFPPQMLDAVKADYVKQWEKGKVLYEMNCAGCHSRTVKGRTVVPDFTADQLQGYGIRVQNEKHEEKLPDEKVSSEELVLISTFLLYKKKNPVR
jgi:mono/diheme cytochrome c family protein